LRNLLLQRLHSKWQMRNGLFWQILAKHAMSDSFMKELNRHKIIFILCFFLRFWQGSKCCGYGSTGKKTSGYDCVIIPGAAKMTAPYTMILGNQAFCGAAGLLTSNSKTSKTGGKTVCSKWQLRQTREILMYLIWALQLLHRYFVEVFVSGLPELLGRVTE
jgi:hypothetical protein